MTTNSHIPSHAPSHARHGSRVTPPSPIPGTAGTPSHIRANRRKNRHRAPLIVLGVAIVLLAIVYVSGVVAFSSICYPHTRIADVDVSLMNLDTASDRVKTAAQHYRLSITGDGFEWSYKPESSTEIIDATAAVKQVIAGNEPFEWPLRLVQAITGGNTASAATEATATPADTKETGTDAPELPAAFDKEAFSEELGTAIDAFNEGRAGTFDAAGAYDAEAGKFTVEKAHSNRRLDKDAITKAALSAVATLTSQVKLDDDSFTPLANGATDEQLQAACDAANKLIGTNVNIKMGGTVVATLDGKQLAQWMTFDDQLTPVLSTDPVKAWVRELAASTLDTIGTDRTYTRPDGKTVTVGGGTYGWNSNEEELVKLLQDAVKNKQVGDIDVPTLQTADKFTAKGQPDWGAYADVDLTEQHARYYDASGNLVWESGIISGKPDPDNVTPTGIYKLNTNNGASVLIGKKDPKTGKPSYESPVSWWMPFVDNLIGFHDATWQAASSFSNPEAYKTVGSHGCINLPLDKAAELAKVIKVGDCVIVHY